jgi:UDP-N-acetylglucosamine 2-epimerase (non-hydrolysing)
MESHSPCSTPEAIFWRHLATNNLGNASTMSNQPSETGPILCIVGARPNFMKMAPILRALGGQQGAPKALLVHTGQHYDVAMSDQLFQDLSLPTPDVNLEVGSATHAVQTAEVMRRFEPVVDAQRPSCVMVVGDVNSTIACALVAAKKGIPVVHVEAGLRSFDRAMPEEINRVLTDQISDVMYTTERSAQGNLAREGIAADRVLFVGNVMIDSLLSHRARAVPIARTLSRAQVDPSVYGAARRFGVVTLHRPSNVDDPEVLAQVVEILVAVSQRLPLVCPLHPRTRANIERFNLVQRLATARIALLPPQGYLEMLGLMDSAAVVLTDSGGIQEETTALSVPCLTMRENTERPITVDEGTNTLVGRDRDLIIRSVEAIQHTGGKRGRVPEFWDGRAAERIAAHLTGWIAERRKRP